MRPKRVDYKGAWYHATNRGVAKRTVFETRREARLFLSRTARVVRAGLIEVHAYSILLNHFHLLVRSVEGRLSEAMRYIQDGYAQRFNLARDRVGPLFQGRFKSSLIETNTYWEIVARYIALNPVRAGLAPDPVAYEFGSARYHANRRGPKWLSLDRVCGAVANLVARNEFDPADYLALFGTGLTEFHVRLVEDRLAAAERAPDYLDDLVGACPEVVRDLMRDRALNADGTPNRLVLVDRTSLLRSVKEAGLGLKDTVILSGGLLRTVCGLGYDEIAQVLGIASCTAYRYAREHARRFRDEDAYSLEASRILQCGLSESFRPPSVEIPFVRPVNE